MQRLLNRASWDCDGTRDDVRSYAVRHLGDAGGVPAAWVTADEAWKRRSCGSGAKGPRVFDWAAATLPEDGTAPPGWSRCLLLRRSLTRNAQGELELACYLCAAPAGTGDEELIRVAGARLPCRHRCERPRSPGSGLVPVTLGEVPWSVLVCTAQGGRAGQGRRC